MSVLFALSLSSVGATDEPPTLPPTASALPTSTLVYNPYATGIPTATPNNSDCPSFVVNPDGLDVNWAKACSRCLVALTPTSPFKIPDYGITPNPVGTPNPDGYTPVPTLTAYVPGTQPPTPTLTSTPVTPMPTSTPSQLIHSWNFLGSSSEGWNFEVVSGATPSTFGTTTMSGVRSVHVTYHPTFGTLNKQTLSMYRDDLDLEHLDSFQVQYATSYVGWSFVAQLYNNNVLQRTISRTFTGVGSGNIEQWFFSPEIAEVDEIIWYAQSPVNGSLDFIFIQGINIGTNIYEILPTPTPTITPIPTSTTVYTNPLHTPSGYDCSVPLYEELEPIIDVDWSADHLYVQTDCYVLIPEVDIGGGEFLGIEVPEIDLEESEICFDLYQMPSIYMLGVTIGTDLIMLVPLLWFVRKLFSF